MLAYATIYVLTSSDIVWVPTGPDVKDVSSFQKAWQSKEGGVESIEAHFMRWSERLSYIWKEEAERCFGHTDWKSLIEGKEFSVVVSNSSGDLKIDLTNPENSELKREEITDSVYKLVRPYIDPVGIDTSCSGHNGVCGYSTRNTLCGTCCQIVKRTRGAMCSSAFVRCA